MSLFDPEPAPRDTDRPSEARLYLWLNCEGWVRFGPFEWLRFDGGSGPADPLVVRGPNDAAVAQFDGTAWRTPGDGTAWRTPTITASPRHPHPMHG